MKGRITLLYLADWDIFIIVKAIVHCFRYNRLSPTKKGMKKIERSQYLSCLSQIYAQVGDYKRHYFNWSKTTCGKCYHCVSTLMKSDSQDNIKWSFYYNKHSYIPVLKKLETD